MHEKQRLKLNKYARYQNSLRTELIIPYVPHIFQFMDSIYMEKDMDEVVMKIAIDVSDTLGSHVGGLIQQSVSSKETLKETLLSLGGQDYETQVEHYKKTVEVAMHKIDVLAGEVEQTKMRETGLVNHMNKFDEGFFPMEKEMNRLGNLAKRTKEEADGTVKKESQMRDDLKEVEDELFYFQEILREARAESLKKDAKILDKETEFGSILHENDCS